MKKCGSDSLIIHSHYSGITAISSALRGKALSKLTLGDVNSLDSIINVFQQIVGILSKSSLRSLASTFG